MDGLKIFSDPGFRAPRVIGFQDMWDIPLIYPQGIGFPLLAGGFEKFWRIQNPRVSRINRSKDPLRGHGLKGFDIFKIQRFQGLRDAEFQGPKV